MVVKLVDKLNELNCQNSCYLIDKNIEVRFGIKCYRGNLTELEKNQKFLKIKKDVINWYNFYSSDDLCYFSNKCDILNIINKI